MQQFSNVPPEQLQEEELSRHTRQHKINCVFLYKSSWSLPLLWNWLYRDKRGFIFTHFGWNWDEKKRKIYKYSFFKFAVTEIRWCNCWLCGKKNKTFIRHTVTGQYKKKDKKNKNKGKKKKENVRKIYTYRYV